ALAEQGKGAEGILQMRQGLAAHQATGSTLDRPCYLAMLAEACGKTGQVEDGLQVVAEALAAVDRTEERFYEAELYGLKGTLTLQSQTSLGQVSDKSQTNQNKTRKSRVGIAHHAGTFGEAEAVGTAHSTREEEAEAYFLKAVEIARKQQAKSLELRAATSLSR